ncbi:MAG: glycosyltransferase family 9 protein [Verrucomicrobiae bacterium]|nr:glycosyltransferase family 9 protein [Verrucomicrobiae bacterium]
MERILVIQMKRIGDLVLTAPALSRLRQARPDAEITLLTMGAAGELAPTLPSIDRHLNYHYRRLNLAVWASVISDRFDTVLDFIGSDRSVFLTWLSRAGTRATYEKRARGFWREIAYTDLCDAKLRDYHTIDHMAALLDAIGIPKAGDFDDPLPLLVIPEGARERAGEILKERGVKGPFALIHPGTAKEEKYWRPERWAEVIRECGTGPLQLPCVITGGADAFERRHIDAIFETLKSMPGVPSPVLLAGRTSLLETAAVIDRATLALGVDTAAMHLAAAFQVPQVVLFGPTNPFHWRPRQGRARIVFSGHPGVMDEGDYVKKIEERPMDAISVAQVIDAISGLPGIQERRAAK